MTSPAAASLPRPRLPLSASPTPARPARRVFHFLLGASWLAIAIFFLAWGLEYYFLPLHDRPYSDLHDLFRPTGTVGNRLGIAGTFLIAFGVASYMVRKRAHALSGVGRLRDWLSFHIWCCTLGPFLILLHTSFRVGGIVAIAFWSMVAVVASGVVGRYVYVRIPRTMNGRLRTMRELEEEQQARLAELRAAGVLRDEEIAGLLPPADEAPAGLITAVAHAVRSDFASRRDSRHLQRVLRQRGVDRRTRGRLAAAARDYRRTAQQRALLAPFARLFGYWHTAHLPFAIVMALVVALHIGVAIAFGYAWTPSP